MSKSQKKISYSFLDEFSIECKNPDTVETILRNRDTNELVLMKEINIGPDDYEETLATLEHQKNLKHQQLISIIDYYCQEKNCLFLVLYQYCEISLMQEFQERLTQERHFDQSELWSIFSSLIFGLSYLQENNVGHGSVSLFDAYLNDEGLIKICDPTAATSSPYSITQGFFYSPQILRSINGGTNEDVNIFKSDAFSLGCCMLQLALMCDITDIFEYETGLINRHRLSNYANELSNLNFYSKEFTNFIMELLQLNFRHRPDFIAAKNKIFSMFSSANPSDISQDMMRKSLDIKSSISSLRRSKSNQYMSQFYKIEPNINQFGVSNNTSLSLKNSQQNQFLFCFGNTGTGSLHVVDQPSQQATKRQESENEGNEQKKMQKKIVSPRRLQKGFLLTTIMDHNQCRQVCKTESDEQEQNQKLAPLSPNNKYKKPKKKQQIQISYVEVKAENGSDAMKLINNNLSPSCYKQNQGSYGSSRIKTQGFEKVKSPEDKKNEIKKSYIAAQTHNINESYESSINIKYQPHYHEWNDSFSYTEKAIQLSKELYDTCNFSFSNNNNGFMGSPFSKSPKQLSKNQQNQRFCTKNNHGITSTLKDKIMNQRPVTSITYKTTKQSDIHSVDNKTYIQMGSLDNSYLFGNKQKIQKPKIEFTFNNYIPKLIATQEDLSFQRNNNNKRTVEKKQEFSQSDRLSLPPLAHKMADPKRQDFYTDLNFLKMMQEDTKNILQRRERMKAGLTN